MALLWTGARHLRRLRDSHETAAARELRASLREEALSLAERWSREAGAWERVAEYDLSGMLQRPAPPAEARAFHPPRGTLAASFLSSGRPERALAEATESPERAAALVALAERGGDPEPLGRALAEEALRGTDLWYWARLRRGADGEFQDLASALVGGPSDRLGRALLRAAGMEPLLDRASRAELFRLRPRPGLGTAGGRPALVEREGERLHLRLGPAGGLGEGPFAEPLPSPFDALAIRGDLDRDALRNDLARESRLLVALYAAAALLFLVGGAFALLAAGRALRLARARSDFVANVTHELKTPLANIRLFAESLRDGRVREPDRPEFVDTILREAGRLDALVEGLLHAARGPRIARAPVTAAELLAEAEARWRPLLEREGFTLEVAPPPATTLRADKEALLRALGNLLDNARKYSRGEKRVSLRAAAAEGRLRLTVADRGPGIPAADRARVLEPFTRLEQAETKSTAGTGLGLSIAAACMEAHGGRIEIGGGAGEGARVALILPAETA